LLRRSTESLFHCGLGADASAVPATEPSGTKACSASSATHLGTSGTYGTYGYGTYGTQVTREAGE